MDLKHALGAGFLGLGVYLVGTSENFLIMIVGALLLGFFASMALDNDK